MERETDWLLNGGMDGGMDDEWNGPMKEGMLNGSGNETNDWECIRLIDGRN